MARWTSTNSDDDFFGTDCDDTSELENDIVRNLDRSNGLLAAHDAAAEEERYRTLGYHETYEPAKELALQDAFIEGYSQAFSVALNIGRQLGQAAIVSQLLTLSAQESPRNGDNKSNDAPEQPYVMAASRIREVLQSIVTSKEIHTKYGERQNSHLRDNESDDSPVDRLRDLESDVTELLGGATLI